MHETVVHPPKHCARAEPAEPVLFVIDDIVADGEESRPRDLSQEARDREQLKRPERGPPWEDHEVRPGPGHPGSDTQPGQRVQPVEERLRARLPERIPARVTARLAGKEPSRVLARER